MTKKLILSIDGGGIRGAAAGQFLCRVEAALQQQQPPVTLRDKVDFYAGTSTGSIIALALATTALSVDTISSLYSHDTASVIFKRRKRFLGIENLFRPKYVSAGKTQLLQEKMGEAKLGDVAPDKHVLAISYGLTSRKPVIIKSNKQQHLPLKSYSVADASSAAPTYFPTKDLLTPGNAERWLIDGGVVANNPTLCVLAEARRTWASSTSLDDIRVVSIGTGYKTDAISGSESQSWGVLQWVNKRRILDLLSDERLINYQALMLCKPGNYIRVNSELRKQPGLDQPPSDAMDDISPSNIESLRKLGDFWFEQYGEATLALIMDSYAGPSLDAIDPHTGAPVEHQL